MTQSHVLKRITLSLCLFLMAYTVSAVNVDSLKRVYDHLPDSKKNNLHDTTAGYLLCGVIDNSEEDSIIGQYALQLKELTEKHLSELKQDEPLWRIYKTYFADALYQLSSICREKGDVITALDYMQQSRSIFEQFQQRPRLGELYNNMAVVYHDIGDESNSIKFLEKSCVIFLSLHDSEKLFRALTNLAYVYYRRNQYPKALNYYRICLEHCRPGEDDYFISECLNSIGLIYCALGEPEKALALHRQSLGIREKINDKRGIATTLNNIGHDYRTLGNYKEALRYSDQSLKMSRELGSIERMRQAASDLKLIYEFLGDYRNALAMQELYIQMRDSTNNEKNLHLAMNRDLKYDYEKKELLLKERQARLEKLYEQKQKFYFVLCIVLLVLTLIVFCSLYLWYRFKKEKESKDLHIELKERLKQEIEEKESIANSLIYIQEHERTKLAAELHDGVNQLLFAAKMQLQASVTVQEDMHKNGVQLLDAAINEIKGIAANEGSFLLKNKLLKDALTDLILQMKGGRDVSISFLNYGFAEDLLNQEQKTNSLRIIQELLSNAIKHADATQHYISVKTNCNTLLFAVTDTGKGIDRDNINKGNGLKNISNKVALMKGTWRLFSIPGKGTKQFIIIPLK